MSVLGLHVEQKPENVANDNEKQSTIALYLVYVYSALIVMLNLRVYSTNFLTKDLT